MTPARVLVCDDVAGFRTMLGALLSTSPLLEVVAEAGDGGEAIAVAEREQPDVVVLDLSMPVLDGLEALPEILRVAPRARVLVLSGFDDGALGPRAAELGAAAYLEKGVGPEAITAEVERLAGAAV